MLQEGLLFHYVLLDGSISDPTRVFLVYTPVANGPPTLRVSTMIMIPVSDRGTSLLPAVQKMLSSSWTAGGWSAEAVCVGGGLGVDVKQSQYMIGSRN